MKEKLIYNNKEKVTIVNNKYKIYMIGSMECPSKNDGGIGWRQKLIPELKKRGIYSFDPTSEEIKKVGWTSQQLAEKIIGWKQSGKWSIFLTIMRKIWRGVTYLETAENGKDPQAVHILGDVDYVENSDFLIWHYDEGDKLGGTIAELVISWYRGIPVYLITQAAISKMNSSILFFLFDSGNGQGEIFKTQNELLQFIDKKYKLVTNNKND